MSSPWIFMGVDRSHFSAKLRPALRYKKIHHLEYPPDQKLIADRTGVGFVPVLFSPEDEVFQDTTDIIDELEARFPDPVLIPSGVDGVVCRLFELYADEFFPTVSMRTRWAYPENEAELRRAFSAFSGNLETGNRIADLMSSYLPMLGVTEATIPAIDAHCDDVLAALDAHFSAHAFLLGDRLSLADCALMGPLYAHLYLDRVTRKKLYEEAIHVCQWIERCNRPVPEQMGECFSGRYPQTLQAILELIGREAVPLLASMETAFNGWAESHAQSGAEVPRGTGTYESVLKGVPFSAGVRGYVPWKIQRFRAAFAACSERDRSETERVLAAAGCASFLAAADNSAALRKEAFQIVFA